MCPCAGQGQGTSQAEEQATEQPSCSSNNVPAGPQTADQWVDYLVQELARSSSIPDAKMKAATVLQRFEGFVTELVKKQVNFSIWLACGPFL
jgi:Parathyroid hormone family